MFDDVKFESLKGETLVDVKVLKDGSDDEIIFHTESGRKITMHHIQDCCEGVWIEDICGDLEGLIGSEILLAEETINTSDDDDDSYGTYTWTFYKLANVNESVTIRWMGQSNGYYSEGVDLSEEQEVPVDIAKRRMDNLN